MVGNFTPKLQNSYITVPEIGTHSILKLGTNKKILYYYCKYSLNKSKKKNAEVMCEKKLLIDSKGIKRYKCTVNQTHLIN